MLLKISINYFKYASSKEFSNLDGFFIDDFPLKGDFGSDFITSFLGNVIFFLNIIFSLASRGGGDDGGGSITFFLFSCGGGDFGGFKRGWNFNDSDVNSVYTSSSSFGSISLKALTILLNETFLVCLVFVGWFVFKELFLVALGVNSFIFFYYIK